MTTLGLRRLRGTGLGNQLVVAGFAIWATVVVGGWLELFAVPGGFLAFVLLTYVLPFAVGVVVLLRQGGPPALPFAAGAACAVPLALIFAAAVDLSPDVGYAVLILAVSAIVAHRFQLGALALMFLVVGTYGSINAFTRLPAASAPDLLLAALWLGVIVRAIIGRRPLALRPGPGMALVAAFMLVTLAAVFLTDPIHEGVQAFRISGWHLTVLILIGYGGFRASTLEGLARAMALACLAVGGYAALRWAIGPAPQEARLLAGSQYDRLSGGGGEKVQGSLPNGIELGVWMSCAIPFLVALALSWRGAIRVVAVAALPLSAIALLGSGLRAGTVGVVAGVLTVIVLHMLSRGFRGPRLGVALTLVVALVVSGVAVFPAVLDNPEKRKRYENILTPEQDLPFQARLTKWRQAVADLRGEPFGFGMGAGNPARVPQRYVRLAASETIDNSYLRIAYDQGLAAMGLFIVMLLVLLVELMRHAVWTRAPGEAALAAAAAGTLVSLMIVLASANVIDTLVVMAGWMIVGLGVAQYASRRADVGAMAASSRQTASFSWERDRLPGTR